MSRSRSSLLGLAALAACLASPTQAFLISQSTQGVSLRHDVRITDHVVRTTVHEGWADVEEEMNLGPQASTTLGSPSPTANLTSWEIAGDFTLPEGSVLTGALLWNGGTILKAKLKGAAQADAEYEDIVDRNTIVLRPTDPLVIRKNGSNYAMKLYPVNWTGTRHLRVRYLVPLQTLGDAWKIPLGSAFAQEIAGRASQYELNIKNEGGTALRLERDGMKTPLSSATKLVDYPAARLAYTWSTPVPLYHAAYAAVLPQKGSIALATHMDSGAWKGGYVMYKGRLPDTLLAKSNLRQEILVLWKWNNPRTFVQTGWSGDEELSYHGRELLSQATNLLQSTRSLTNSSPLVRVGLVSDEGDTAAPRTFPLAGAQSDTFALLQDYLAGIDQQTLLHRYDPIGGTGTDVVNTAQDRKAGALRFASDLKIAFSLYSKDSGVVRHIAFVTAGPATDLADPTVALPTWPEGLTASAYARNLYTSSGAHWTGVDLPSLINQHALPATRQAVGTHPFAVPQSRVTWSLEFKAGDRRFSVDATTGLTGNASAILEFNGHALAPWEKTLSWTLYDETGTVLRTAEEPAANWIQLPKDSAVARLWGGSAKHWSETRRTRTVGEVYGFVDPNYSLLAVPADSLGAIAQARYGVGGVPFLLGSEIVVAKDTAKEPTTTTPGNPGSLGTIKGSLGGFSVRALAGSHGLRIALPAGLDASCLLVVRDLRGRILSQWSGARFASLRTLDWNAGTVRGMVTVELRTPAGRTVLAASIL